MWREIMYNWNLINTCRYLESKGFKVNIEYSKTIYRPYLKWSLYKSIYVPFKVGDTKLKFASINEFYTY